MKISEITADFVLDYIREDKEDADAVAMVEAIMPAAKANLIGRTALTEEELDDHEDLTFAYLIICEDLYDTRSATVSNSAENKTLETILSLYAKNHIG